MNKVIEYQLDGKLHMHVRGLLPGCLSLAMTLKTYNNYQRLAMPAARREATRTCSQDWNETRVYHHDGTRWYPSTDAFRIVYRFELFSLRKNQQFHNDPNFYSTNLV